MMLSVQSVTVRYGAMRALQNVDLNVSTGELVAVVGPNGAGKSTLLRCISGLVAPASGDIVFDGARITGLAAYRVARLGLAHVPEGRGIVGTLSTRENLMMGGRGKQREVDAKVDDILGLFPALAPRMGVPGGLLSGGEQQMLSIGRALMGSPRLLMIDEPTMGLAPIVVEQVLQSLSAVLATGTSVLLVEQNTAVALEVADRTYVLVNGEVVLSGTAHELNADLLEVYIH